MPSVKAHLWGGAFWSSGFSIDTVGRHGSEDVIRRYVQNQGQGSDYRKRHEQQFELFADEALG